MHRWYTEFLEVFPAVITFFWRDAKNFSASLRSQLYMSLRSIAVSNLCNHIHFGPQPLFTRDHKMLFTDTADCAQYNMDL